MLNQLKAQIVEECQVVLDYWQQDEDGYDHEFGYGGACDAIAETIQSVVVENCDDAEVFDGGQPGDNHAWVRVLFDDGSEYGIDIPAHIYEHGSGYVWTKIEGVVLEPEHVDIWQIS